MRDLPAEYDAASDGLVDLAFDELAVPGDSVFARSLRRRNQEIGQGGESIASYNSALILVQTEDTDGG